MITAIDPDKHAPNVSPTAVAPRVLARLRAPVPAYGFTLIEMAVVLVVVSLVLGSLLVPLTSQVEQRRVESTEQILEQARDAVLAFAAARGRLPCPGTSNGQELPPNETTGECPARIGFLPAATLGLSPLDIEGYVRDGWGLEQNRIRYAVSDALVNSVSNVFTRTDGIRLATIPKFYGREFLYVCNSGVGATSAPACSFALTKEAVAVIWSVGPNAATTGGLSDDEKQNPNPNSNSNPDPTARIFVSRPRGSVAGAEFDDQMVWITPPLLFQRMIAAGQLP